MAEKEQMLILWQKRILKEDETRFHGSKSKTRCKMLKEDETQFHGNEL